MIGTIQTPELTVRFVQNLGVRFGQREQAAFVVWLERQGRSDCGGS